MNSWPDTQFSLIERLANPEDASAWKHFEQYYQATIYRLARARGLQPDEARDVVQEVMLAVHRRAVQWTPSGHRGSFRAWLAETTRRQAFASLRFRARGGLPLQVIDDPLQMEPEDPQRDDPQRDERDWHFYRAVAEVERETSPEHWKAFWMTAIEGDDATLVASTLGMKVGTVYSIKSRILTKIKEHITQGLSGIDARSTL